MAHELKRIWSKAVDHAVMYCEDCETAYPYEWLKNHEICPSITGISCNRCGQDMLSEQGAIYGHEAFMSSGYESPVFEDGYQYRWRLCEKCLQEMFSQFVLPVERRSYLDHSDWEPVQN